MSSTLSLFPTEEQNTQQLVMINNNRVVNEKTSFISCALEKMVYFCGATTTYIGIARERSYLG